MAGDPSEAQTRREETGSSSSSCSPSSSSSFTSSTSRQACRFSGCPPTSFSPPNYASCGAVGLPDFLEARASSASLMQQWLSQAGGVASVSRRVSVHRSAVGGHINGLDIEEVIFCLLDALRADSGDHQKTFLLRLHAALKCSALRLPSDSRGGAESAGDRGDTCGTRGGWESCEEDKAGAQAFRGRERGGDAFAEALQLRGSGLHSSCSPQVSLRSAAASTRLLALDSTDAVIETLYLFAEKHLTLFLLAIRSFLEVRITLEEHQLAIFFVLLRALGLWIQQQTPSPLAGTHGDVVERRDRGERGEAGNIGERGEAENRGERGEAGNRGERGEPENRGEIGEVGDEWAEGDKGDLGAGGGELGRQGMARGEEGEERTAGEPSGREEEKVETPRLLGQEEAGRKQFLQDEEEQVAPWENEWISFALREYPLLKPMDERKLCLGIAMNMIGAIHPKTVLYILAKELKKMRKAAAFPQTADLLHLLCQLLPLFPSHLSLSEPSRRILLSLPSLICSSYSSTGPALRPLASSASPLPSVSASASASSAPPEDRLPPPTEEGAVSPESLPDSAASPVPVAVRSRLRLAACSSLSTASACLALPCEQSLVAAALVGLAGQTQAALDALQASAAASLPFARDCLCCGCTRRSQTRSQGPLGEAGRVREADADQGDEPGCCGSVKTLGKLPSCLALRRLSPAVWALGEEREENASFVAGVDCEAETRDDEGEKEKQREDGETRVLVRDRGRNPVSAAVELWRSLQEILLPLLLLASDEADGDDEETEEATFASFRQALSASLHLLHVISHQNFFSPLSSSSPFPWVSARGVSRLAHFVEHVRTLLQLLLLHLLCAAQRRSLVHAVRRQPRILRRRETKKLDRTARGKKRASRRGAAADPALAGDATEARRELSEIGETQEDNAKGSPKVWEGDTTFAQFVEFPALVQMALDEEVRVFIHRIEGESDDSEEESQRSAGTGTESLPDPREVQSLFLLLLRCMALDTALSAFSKERGDGREEEKRREEEREEGETRKESDQEEEERGEASHSGGETAAAGERLDAHPFARLLQRELYPILVTSTAVLSTFHQATLSPSSSSSASTSPFVSPFSASSSSPVSPSSAACASRPVGRAPSLFAASPFAIAAEPLLLADFLNPLAAAPPADASAALAAVSANASLWSVLSSRLRRETPLSLAHRNSAAAQRPRPGVLPSSFRSPHCPLSPAPASRCSSLSEISQTTREEDARESEEEKAAGEEGEDAGEEKSDLFACRGALERGEIAVAVLRSICVLARFQLTSVPLFATLLDLLRRGVTRRDVVGAWEKRREKEEEHAARVTLLVMASHVVAVLPVRPSLASLRVRQLKLSACGCSPSLLLKRSRPQSCPERPSSSSSLSAVGLCSVSASQALPLRAPHARCAPQASEQSLSAARPLWSKFASRLAPVYLQQRGVLAEDLLLVRQLFCVIAVYVLRGDAVRLPALASALLGLLQCLAENHYFSHMSLLEDISPEKANSTSNSLHASAFSLLVFGNAGEDPDSARTWIPKNLPVNRFLSSSSSSASISAARESSFRRRQEEFNLAFLKSVCLLGAPWEALLTLEEGATSPAPSDPSEAEESEDETGEEGEREEDDFTRELSSSSGLVQGSASRLPKPGAGQRNGCSPPPEVDEKDAQDTTPFSSFFSLGKASAIVSTRPQTREQTAGLPLDSSLPAIAITRPPSDAFTERAGRRASPPSSGDVRSASGSLAVPPRSRQEKESPSAVSLVRQAWCGSPPVEVACLLLFALRLLALLPTDAGGGATAESDSFRDKAEELRIRDRATRLIERDLCKCVPGLLFPLLIEALQQPRLDRALPVVFRCLATMADVRACAELSELPARPHPPTERSTDAARGHAILPEEVASPPLSSPHRASPSHSAAWLELLSDAVFVKRQADTLAWLLFYAGANPGRQTELSIGALQALKSLRPFLFRPPRASSPLCSSSSPLCSSSSPASLPSPVLSSGHSGTSNAVSSSDSSRRLEEVAVSSRLETQANLHLDGLLAALAFARERHECAAQSSDCPLSSSLSSSSLSSCSSSSSSSSFSSSASSLCPSRCLLSPLARSLSCLPWTAELASQLLLHVRACRFSLQMFEASLSPASLSPASLSPASLSPASRASAQPLDDFFLLHCLCSLLAVAASLRSLAGQSCEKKDMSTFPFARQMSGLSASAKDTVREQAAAASFLGVLPLSLPRLDVLLLHLVAVCARETSDIHVRSAFLRALLGAALDDPTALAGLASRVGAETGQRGDTAGTDDLEQQKASAGEAWDEPPAAGQRREEDEGGLPPPWTNLLDRHKKAGNRDDEEKLSFARGRFFSETRRGVLTLHAVVDACLLLTQSLPAVAHAFQSLPLSPSSSSSSFDLSSFDSSSSSSSSSSSFAASRDRDLSTFLVDRAPEESTLASKSQKAPDRGKLWGDPRAVKRRWREFLRVARSAAADLRVALLTPDAARRTARWLARGSGAPWLRSQLVLPAASEVVSLFTDLQTASADESSAAAKQAAAAKKAAAAKAAVASPKKVDDVAVAAFASGGAPSANEESSFTRSSSTDLRSSRDLRSSSRAAATGVGGLAFARFPGAASRSLSGRGPEPRGWRDSVSSAPLSGESARLLVVARTLGVVASAEAAFADVWRHLVHTEAACRPKARLMSSFAFFGKSETQVKEEKLRALLLFCRGVCAANAPRTCFSLAQLLGAAQQADRLLQKAQGAGEREAGGRGGIQTRGKTAGRDHAGTFVSAWQGFAALWGAAAEGTVGSDGGVDELDRRGERRDGKRAASEAGRREAAETEEENRHTGQATHADGGEEGKEPHKAEKPEEVQRVDGCEERPTSVARLMSQDKGSIWKRNAEEEERDKHRGKLEEEREDAAGRAWRSWTPRSEALKANQTSLASPFSALLGESGEVDLAAAAQRLSAEIDAILSPLEMHQEKTASLRQKRNALLSTPKSTETHKRASRGLRSESRRENISGEGNGEKEDIDVSCESRRSTGAAVRGEDETEDGEEIRQSLSTEQEGTAAVAQATLLSFVRLVLPLYNISGSDDREVALALVALRAVAGAQGLRLVSEGRSLCSRHLRGTSDASGVHRGGGSEGGPSASLSDASPLSRSRQLANACMFPEYRPLDSGLSNGDAVGWTAFLLPETFVEAEDNDAAVWTERREEEERSAAKRQERELSGTEKGERVRSGEEEESTWSDPGSDRVANPVGRGGEGEQDTQDKMREEERRDRSHHSSSCLSWASEWSPGDALRRRVPLLNAFTRFSELVLLALLPLVSEPRGATRAPLRLLAREVCAAQEVWRGWRRQRRPGILDPLLPLTSLLRQRGHVILRYRDASELLESFRPALLPALECMRAFLTLAFPSSSLAFDPLSSAAEEEREGKGFEDRGQETRVLFPVDGAVASVVLLHILQLLKVLVPTPVAEFLRQWRAAHLPAFCVSPSPSASRFFGASALLPAPCEASSRSTFRSPLSLVSRRPLDAVAVGSERNDSAESLPDAVSSRHPSLESPSEIPRTPFAFPAGRSRRGKHKPGELARAHAVRASDFGKYGDERGKTAPEESRFVSFEQLCVADPSSSVDRAAGEVILALHTQRPEWTATAALFKSIHFRLTGSSSPFLRWKGLRLFLSLAAQAPMLALPEAFASSLFAEVEAVAGDCSCPTDTLLTHVANIPISSFLPPVSSSSSRASASPSPRPSSSSGVRLQNALGWLHCLLLTLPRLGDPFEDNRRLAFAVLRELLLRCTETARLLRLLARDSFSPAETRQAQSSGPPGDSEILDSFQETGRSGLCSSASGRSRGVHGRPIPEDVLADKTSSVSSRFPAHKWRQDDVQVAPAPFAGRLVLRQAPGDEEDSETHAVCEDILHFLLAAVHADKSLSSRLLSFFLLPLAEDDVGTSALFSLLYCLFFLAQRRPISMLSPLASSSEREQKDAAREEGRSPRPREEGDRHRRGSAKISSEAENVFCLNEPRVSQEDTKEQGGKADRGNAEDRRVEDASLFFSPLPLGVSPPARETPEERQARLLTAAIVELLNRRRKVLCGDLERRFRETEPQTETLASAMHTGSAQTQTLEPRGSRGGAGVSREEEDVSTTSVKGSPHRSSRRRSAPQACPSSSCFSSSSSLPASFSSAWSASESRVDSELRTWCFASFPTASSPTFPVFPEGLVQLAALRCVAEAARVSLSAVLSVLVENSRVRSSCRLASDAELGREGDVLSGDALGRENRKREKLDREIAADVLTRPGQCCLASLLPVGRQQPSSGEASRRSAGKIRGCVHSLLANVLSESWELTKQLLRLLTAVLNNAPCTLSVTAGALASRLGGDGDAAFPAEARGRRGADDFVPQLERDRAKVDTVLLNPSVHQATLLLLLLVSVRGSPEGGLEEQGGAGEKESSQRDERKREEAPARPPSSSASTSFSLTFACANSRGEKAVRRAVSRHFPLLLATALLRLGSSFSPSASPSSASDAPQTLFVACTPAHADKQTRAEGSTAVSSERGFSPTRPRSGSGADAAAFEELLRDPETCASPRKTSREEANDAETRTTTETQETTNSGREDRKSPDRRRSSREGREREGEDGGEEGSFRLTLVSQREAVDAAVALVHALVVAAQETELLVLLKKGNIFENMQKETTFLHAVKDAMTCFLCLRPSAAGAVLAFVLPFVERSEKMQALVACELIAAVASSLFLSSGSAFLSLTSSPSGSAAERSGRLCECSAFDVCRLRQTGKGGFLDLLAFSSSPLLSPRPSSRACRVQLSGLSAFAKPSAPFSAMSAARPRKASPLSHGPPPSLLTLELDALLHALDRFSFLSDLVEETLQSGLSGQSEDASLQVAASRPWYFFGRAQEAAGDAQRCDALRAQTTALQRNLRRIFSWKNLDVFAGNEELGTRLSPDCSVLTALKTLFSALAALTLLWANRLGRRRGDPRDPRGQERDSGSEPEGKAEEGKKDGEETDGTKEGEEAETEREEREAERDEDSKEEKVEFLFGSEDLATDVVATLKTGLCLVPFLLLSLRASSETPEIADAVEMASAACEACVYACTAACSVAPTAWPSLQGPTAFLELLEDSLLRPHFLTFLLLQTPHTRLRCAVFHLLSNLFLFRDELLLADASSSSSLSTSSDGRLRSFSPGASGTAASSRERETRNANLSFAHLDELLVCATGHLVSEDADLVVAAASLLDRAVLPLLLVDSSHAPPVCSPRSASSLPSCASPSVFPAFPSPRATREREESAAVAAGRQALRDCLVSLGVFRSASAEGVEGDRCRQERGDETGKAWRGGRDVEEENLCSRSLGSSEETAFLSRERTHRPIPPLLRAQAVQQFVLKLLPLLLRSTSSRLPSPVQSPRPSSSSSSSASSSPPSALSSGRRRGSGQGHFESAEQLCRRESVEFRRFGTSVEMGVQSSPPSGRKHRPRSAGVAAPPCFELHASPAWLSRLFSLLLISRASFPPETWALRVEPESQLLDAQKTQAEKRVKRRLEKVLYGHPDAALAAAKAAAQLNAAKKRGEYFFEAQKLPAGLASVFGGGPEDTAQGLEESAEKLFRKFTSYFQIVGDIGADREDDGAADARGASRGESSSGREHRGRAGRRRDEKEREDGEGEEGEGDEELGESDAEEDPSSEDDSEREDGDDLAVSAELRRWRYMEEFLLDEGLPASRLLLGMHASTDVFCLQEAPPSVSSLSPSLSRSIVKGASSSSEHSGRMQRERKSTATLEARCRESFHVARETQRLSQVTAHAAHVDMFLGSSSFALAVVRSIAAVLDTVPEETRLRVKDFLRLEALCVATTRQICSLLPAEQKTHVEAASTEAADETSLRFRKAAAISLGALALLRPSLRSDDVS
ncbi:hypothetical protein TGME49_205562 [Toxoplasma gondii ME49]|uniref:Collagen triple helix protein n=2 Tax=Toxoplasma gondii TaxID=5811 RepID=S8F5J9_TOXGM|nr:hypothetical protein TGME49_205562 [Toxoplasma gondii ME49]EPT29957.1 hypothetical protein TGME49_205562 [Toxoplasma gondii ME49]|eukprot:XP_018637269.1 hypothetical protein TGME49_205562 [Toxoplasma gondii ME49]